MDDAPELSSNFESIFSNIDNQCFIFLLNCNTQSLVVQIHCSLHCVPLSTLLHFLETMQEA